MKLLDCMKYLVLLITVILCVLVSETMCTEVRGGVSDLIIYGRTGDMGLVPLEFKVDDKVGDLIEEYKNWYLRNIGRQYTRGIEIHYHGKPLKPHELLSDTGISLEAVVEIITTPPQWKPINELVLDEVLRMLERNNWIVNDDIKLVMYRGDSNISIPGDGKLYNIEEWDVSNITNMCDLFQGSRTFNEDIGRWDTSNVTNMARMFHTATTFNQNIGGWNTSNVGDMSLMFAGAELFNQYIGGWDTSNVMNMMGMFRGASAFNQNIKKWNTVNVRNMASMFRKASSFCWDIRGWDITNVNDRRLMFSDAHAFRRIIGVW